MNRTRGRLVVACLALIGAVIAVAGGSAGNRNGVGSLDSPPRAGNRHVRREHLVRGEVHEPQPDERIGLHADEVRMTRRSDDVALPAKAGATSCGAFDLLTDVLTCYVRHSFVPGAAVTLTVTWKAPGTASQPGCLVDVVAGIHCLKADGTFLIKEGKQTNFNESFPVSEDAVVDRRQRHARGQPEQASGGFETCGTGLQGRPIASRKLEPATNARSAVDTSRPPSACRRSRSRPRALIRGLRVEIVEEARTGGPGTSRTSAVDRSASPSSARTASPGLPRRLRRDHANHTSRSSASSTRPCCPGTRSRRCSTTRAAPFVPDQTRRTRDGCVVSIKPLERAIRRSGRSSGSPRRTVRGPIELVHTTSSRGGVEILQPAEHAAQDHDAAFRLREHTRPRTRGALRPAGRRLPGLRRARRHRSGRRSLRSERGTRAPRG